MKRINQYDPNQHISVAVDCIIFGFDSKSLKLLLFKRKVNPFKGHWSLIGALIRNEVSLDEGANEVIFTLTGLHDIYLKQLRTYGAVDRDPLERVISVAYYSLIRIDTFDDDQLDSYGAKWFNFNEVPELILDHSKMVDDAVRKLRLNARNQPLGFELLPEYFTLPQLQTLYESIYNTTFDPRNFRKKILSLKILEKSNKKDMSGSKKGAYLYRFIKSSLEGSSTRNGDFDTIKEVIQF